MWNDFSHKPEAVATLLAAIIAATAGVWNFFVSKRQQKELANHESRLETKMQTSLDSFRDTLERHRTYDVFQRERLNSHIEKVIEAFNELFGLGDTIILKSWIDAAKSLEAEEQFRKAWRRLDTHRAALLAFGAISPQLDRDFEGVLGAAGTSWDKALGELARKNPANLPAGHRAFSEKEYFDAWQKLMDDLCALRNMVAKVSAQISLPR